MSGEKNCYNNKYQVKNYFGYREWIYSSYIACLISISGLKYGSSILDAGCGQGFFSYLFCKYGLKVYGIDISETGIRTAKSNYGPLGIKFVVGDVKVIPFSYKFDCVFTRSCSLYNTINFPIEYQVTEGLLSHVRNGGTFIFAYNTNLSHLRKSDSWHYHTLSDVKNHFLRYSNARIFFISKIDVLLIKKFAFNFLSSIINMFLSKALGLGGDLVCIIRKSENDY